METGATGHVRARGWQVPDVLRAMRPAVKLSAVLLAASALAYSGGHNYDAQAAHYHLVHNFLCDQFLRVNWYNGRPNGLGAALGIAGALVLVLGALLPSWIVLPRRIGAGRLTARVLPATGVLACAAALLLPLEEDLALGLPHYAVVLAAAGPAWIATAGTALVIFRHPRATPMTRMLSLVLLAAVPAILAVYLPHALAGELTPPALAVAQKLLLVAAMAWLHGLPALAGAPR